MDKTETLTLQCRAHWLLFSNLKMRGVQRVKDAVLQCTTGGRLRCASSGTDASIHTGIVELRQYTLKPEGMKEFVRITAEKADLRNRLLPFLG